MLDGVWPLESTSEGREELHIYKLDLADPIFGVPELYNQNLRPKTPETDFVKQCKIQPLELLKELIKRSSLGAP